MLYFDITDFFKWLFWNFNNFRIFIPLELLEKL